MEKQKGTIGLGKVIGFGMGGMFGYGFQLMVTGYFLMYFMTDVAGFDAGLAAGINSGVQIIKLVSMLFSGVIIDSINFKSGKYRTWCLVAGVLLGVFFPATFFYYNLPVGVYVVVFLIIVSLQFIAYNVGWTAMRAAIGSIAKNQADLVNLNTSAQTCGTLSSTIFGYIYMPLLGVSLWAGTKNAYGWMAAIFGVIIIIGSFYLYNLVGKLQTTEVEAKSQKGPGFFEMFKALKGPMIPYFISYVLAAASSVFYSTLLVYYTNYVLMDPVASGKSLTWNAIAGFVGCLATPYLTKFMSKKTVHIVGMVGSAIGYACLAKWGSSSTAFIVIRALINVIGCASTVCMSALCNDIADKFEMQGQEAPRAMLQGLAGATTRVGLTIATPIASFALAAIGYKAGVTFTPEMIKSMVTLIAVIPSGICVLAALCMLFYHVDEKEIEEYNVKKHAQN